MPLPGNSSWKHFTSRKSQLYFSYAYDSMVIEFQRILILFYTWTLPIYNVSTIFYTWARHNQLSISSTLTIFLSYRKRSVPAINFQKYEAQLFMAILCYFFKAFLLISTSKSMRTEGLKNSNCKLYWFRDKISSYSYYRFDKDKTLIFFMTFVN